jgi:pilus assembly protein CpaC
VQISLEAGAGRLVQLPGAASTVLAADPRVVRVQPASPSSIFLMALGQGRSTVVATNEAGVPIAEYDVIVRPSRFAPPPERPAGEAPAAGAQAATPPPNAAALEATLRGLIRGAQGLSVSVAPRGVILSGSVPTAADAQRADAIAQAYAGPERPVINELTLLSSIQVNVRVRVAEISRQISRDLGFNWQALGNAGSWTLGLRTGSLVGAVADVLTQSSFGNEVVGRVGVGVQTSRLDANAIIDALASDQLITILAEPNLTAQSGETASFLVGGEFPVPVAAQNGNSVTIEFKQFGVSLSFVPTVLSPGRLNLRVRPEVSELSENGAISIPISGGTITVPALAVRRAETTIELGSGQSFAIAGLLQRNITQTGQGIAGLSEVPVLGALFRSTRFARNETELVIIVTPYLVRPAANPSALAAPTDGFRAATDLDRILYQRQLARGVPAAMPRTRLDAGFILE